MFVPLAAVDREMCWVFYNVPTNRSSAINYCNSLNADILSIRNDREQQQFVDSKYVSDSSGFSYVNVNLKFDFLNTTGIG